MELLTRTAKRLYEERHLLSENGIDKLMFRELDIDTSSSILLDRYVKTPYAASYINPGNQSIIREFEAGSGQLLTPPRISEKTPIDEELEDAVATGVEPTAGDMASIIKNVDYITKDFIEAFNMTKWKQAIDVIREGIFVAHGVRDQDLGLSLDLGRHANLGNLTADFAPTAGGSVRLALQNIIEELRAQGTPLDGLVTIMGRSWLTLYANDAAIREMRQNNTANELVQSNIEAQLLNNTYGLYVIDRLRDPASLAPVWICSFSPGVQYKPSRILGATPWIPDDEMIMFSLADSTYRILRGIRAFNNSGTRVRVAGEMVLDSFYDNDPIRLNIRAQSRHLYAYGNINHTARMTGRNFPGGTVAAMSIAGASLGASSDEPNSALSSSEGSDEDHDNDPPPEESSSEKTKGATRNGSSSGKPKKAN